MIEVQHNTYCPIWYCLLNIGTKLKLKPVPEGGIFEFESAAYECEDAAHVFYINNVKRTDVTEFEV